MATDICARIKLIGQQVPPEVKLIATTKQVGVEAMRLAYQAGVRDFGENRVQEFLTKQEQLQDLVDVNWHFIGHIQKNKAKKVIEHFDWIHSVDSLALAKRLDRLAGELNKIPKVLLQVKMLPDPNKYGWEASKLEGDLAQLNEYKHLNICGLMTILPYGLSSTEAASAFAQTQNLATTIARKNYNNLSMEQLSMGMSEDYLLAIAAGATMIRPGRIIFGERKK